MAAWVFWIALVLAIILLYLGLADNLFFGLVSITVIVSFLDYTGIFDGLLGRVLGFGITSKVAWFFWIALVLLILLSNIISKLNLLDNGFFLLVDFLVLIAVIISFLDYSGIVKGLMGNILGFIKNVIGWISEHGPFVFIVFVSIITLLIVAVIVKIFALIVDGVRNAKEIKKWKRVPVKKFEEKDILDLLTPFNKELSDSDSNANVKYSNNIPYGRANCFLNYFNKSIYIEDPLYYSPIRSKNEIELMEYGFLMTNGGIYILRQEYDSAKQEYIKKRGIIDFSGMVKVWCWNKNNEEYISFTYADKNKCITYKQSATTVPLSCIQKICQNVIDSGLSRSLYEGQVYKDNALIDQEFEVKQKADGIVQGVKVGAAVSVSDKVVERYEQMGNVMNAHQGGGYAAELYNDTVDRAKAIFTGDKVEYLGQQKDENGRIIKGGADRRVNGVNIQTKYYKTAKDSIGAAFEDGHAKYLNDDGSMMMIEVPRDQYKDACIEMEKRIENGEVPGAEPGDSSKYVKEGKATYKQAQNITKAGAIEAIGFDALNGIICSVPTATVSSIIVFASCVWNGMDPEEAIQESLSTFGNILKQSGIQAAIIGLLKRKEFEIPNSIAAFIKNESETVGDNSKTVFYNPLYKLSNGLIEKIKKSDMANSSIGKILEIDKMTPEKLLNGATIAFTFGPDICRALVGRISPQQLFKNTCIGVAGIAGAKIGAKIGGATFGVVGAVVGGMIGTAVAKKTLDNFIEDDAKEMYQILKEEFLDVVMIAGLNQKEFEYVISTIFDNKKLPKMLRDMYQYGDARKYARENIVSETVVFVYSQRTRITQNMYKKAMFDFVKNTYNELYSQPINVEYEEI